MAAKYYRLAIATSLTNDEVEGIDRGSRTPGTPLSIIKARFDISTREQLAECLQDQNQLEEAQKWNKEAAAIRQQHDLGKQSADVRGLTMEQELSEILAAEQTRGGDPLYWLERARLYQSANDSAKAEHAFQTGLALAPPDPQRSGTGNIDSRHRIFYFYVSFLTDEKRLKDIDDLLWKELSQSPAMSASGVFAVSHLVRHNKQQLTVDHPVLWTWLGNRTLWNDEIEGKLLDVMLRNGTPNDLELAHARAEQLALDVDPGRALVLGRLENKMAFPQRSIPLLEYAVRTFPKKYDQVQALNVLIDSCLDVNDLQQAERSIQQIGQLYPVSSETDGVAMPEWLTRAAVKAAKAGDKTAAMRYWRKAANLNLMDTGPVAVLASAGLKQELIEFYREMQQSLPTSEVPPLVLQSLQ